MPTPQQPVVLLGAGGHARVLISLLKLINRPIAAILDDDITKHGTLLHHTPITAGLDTITQYHPRDVQLVNAIGSAHRPTTRQAIYERLTNQGYTFATLIHPAATIAPETHIEPGVQVMAGAIIQAGATLKANCLINTAATIDHDTTIGQHTHIAPGVTICGNATLGPTCHIGAGATIIQGITLGQGVVVGAGATVLNDVTDGLTVFGTPARPFPA